MLPVLTDEQKRVLGSMNRYWQEISKRDESWRSQCAKNEIVVIQDCITPMDILLILGNFVENNFAPFQKVPFDLQPYLHHADHCNLNQNWDEAAQALADTPTDQRDEGYHMAVQEMEEKRRQCTCRYNEIITQQKVKS